MRPVFGGFEGSYWWFGPRIRRGTGQTTPEMCRSRFPRQALSRSSTVRPAGDLERWRAQLAGADRITLDGHLLAVPSAREPATRTKSRAPTPAACTWICAATIHLRRVMRPSLLDELAAVMQRAGPNGRERGADDSTQVDMPGRLGAVIDILNRVRAKPAGAERGDVPPQRSDPLARYRGRTGMAGRS
jgi:hypothetical protein